METPQEPDPVGRRALHESNPGLVSPDPGEGAETGTTVVGVVADESVVLAADQRASIGGRVVTNKHVRKVEPVHPTAAAALSGTVGHLQQFVRVLRAETRLYADRRDTDPSMTALSTLAGNVLRNSGLQVSPLLGGVDDTGGHIFEVDGAGGVLRDTYAAGGSGMQLAYGALEDAYRDNLTTEDARAVAASAVESASERDTASGNGVTVATVTREGVQVEAYADAGEVA
ncbi:proteasome subunit beta [Salarchaeum sp. III]|uniref:proteasome subunit beta n=1 Tax=Salarchaeum sp. III TaxID=3107927 RepID=UPI002EDB1444